MGLFFLSVDLSGARNIICIVDVDAFYPPVVDVRIVHTAVDNSIMHRI